MDPLPPSLLTAGLLQPAPAGQVGLAILLAELTEALAQLPAGTQIPAVVTQILPQAPPQMQQSSQPALNPGPILLLSTPDGPARMRVPAAVQIPIGAKLEIAVAAASPQPQWRLTAIDGKPVSPSPLTFSTSAPVPAPSIAKADMAPRPTTTPGIPATLVKSADPTMPSGTTLLVRIVALVPPAAPQPQPQEQDSEPTALPAPPEEPRQAPSPAPIAAPVPAVAAPVTVALSQIPTPSPAPQPAVAAPVPAAVPIPTQAPATTLAAPVPVTVSMPEAAPGLTSAPAPMEAPAPVPAPAQVPGATPALVTVTAAAAPVSTHAPALVQTQTPVPTPLTAPVAPPAPTSAPVAVPVVTAAPASTQAPVPAQMQAPVPTPVPPPVATSASTPASAPIAAASASTQAPATAPVPPPPEIGGEVLPNSDAGRPLVKTPVGLLALSIEPQSAPPAGAHVTLAVIGKPVPPAAPNLAPPPDYPPDKALPRRLTELIEQVQSSGNEKLAETVRQAIPAPGSKLAAQLLSVIASAEPSQGLPRWLGEGLAAALTHSAPEAAAQLSRQWEVLSQPVQGPDNGDWRTLLLPLMMGGQMNLIRLTTRNPRRGATPAEREKGTRFLLDLDLSLLGPMQFDGLVKRQHKHFDLIIRTRDPLPGEMRRDIDGLFLNGLMNFGLQGSVVFQPDGRFVATPRLTGDANGIIFA